MKIETRCFVVPRNPGFVTSMRAALLALACMTLPKAKFVPLPSQRATAEVRRLEAVALKSDEMMIIISYALGIR